MKHASNSMSSAIVAEIKRMLATGQYYQHQIAALLGINQGRVSETKKGEWDWMLNLHDKQTRLF